MPYMVNGIGTWHWGKSNQFRRQGLCESCGRGAVLSSYDTTHFFVVFFIPIIPLGRRRVIDHCPHCERFRMMPLGKWEQLKTDRIMLLLQEWQANPNDADRSLSVLEATVAFQDPAAFDDVIAGLPDVVRQRPRIAAMIAQGYDYFGQIEQAEQAYEDLLAVTDDRELRDEAGRFYIRNNQPAKAEPLLRHILEQKRANEAGLLMALVESYWIAGESERASCLVDELTTTFPQLLNDPDLRRLEKKVAKKRRGAPPSRETARLGPQRDRIGSRNGPMLIAMTVIALLIAGYMTMAFVAAANRTVYVINGLDHSYDVLINGERHTLPPRRPVSLALGEGEVTMAVAGRPDLPPEIAPVRTPFWSRPFASWTIVLNPDRTALIEWSQTVYASGNGHDEPAPPALHVGQPMYAFRGVEYAFAPLPSQLRVSNEGAVRYVDQLSVLDLPLEDLYAICIDHVSPEAALELARRRALLDESDPVPLALIESQFEPSETLAFLRPMLEMQPLHVQAHRSYQNIIERSDPEHDLVAEYRKRLDAAPSDKDLIYLYGRVVPDPAQAHELMLKAAAEPNPSAHALGALAVEELQEAHFREALEHARKARRLDSLSASFRYLESEALEALRDYDALLAAISNERLKRPENLDLVRQEVYLLACKGRGPEARARLDALGSKMRTEGATDEHIELMRNVLLAGICYAEGDMDGFCKAVGRVSPEPGFPVLLTRGDCAGALAMLDTGEETSLEQSLALYLAAQSHGATDVAERAMAMTIDTLRQGSPQERDLAAALSGGEVPTDATLRGVAYGCSERALLFASLGLRYPEHQATYFAHARRLNFSRQFPSQVVRDVVEKKAG